MPAASEKATVKRRDDDYLMTKLLGGDLLRQGCSEDVHGRDVHLREVGENLLGQREKRYIRHPSPDCCLQYRERLAVPRVESGSSRRTGQILCFTIVIFSRNS